MCENSTTSYLGMQDPRGCRFIHGDPGSGDWGYCQGEIAPGGKLGSLEKPPYCAEHAKICLRETNEYYIERWIRRAGGWAGNIDRNVLNIRAGGVIQADQRMPLDIQIALINSGKGGFLCD